MEIQFKALRDKWMADSQFQGTYERISPEVEIAFAIAEARHRAKLTQEQLAERLETSQAAVARWENGTSMPTTKTLKQMAEATKCRLHVELLPA